LKISAALGAGKGGPEYLKRFFSEGREALEISRRKIEDALFSFEKAQIFTLHGFALGVLEEFAFDASFFAQDHEDEIDPSENLKKYIKDFLRVELDPDFISSSQLKKLCTFTGKDSEALSNALLRILQKGEKIRWYPPAKQRYDLWNETIRSFGNPSAKDLWHDYAVAAPRLVKSEGRKEQAESLFSSIEKGSCSFQDFEALLGEKELFLASIKFEKTKKENFKLSGLLEEIQKKLVPLHLEACNPKILLLQLAGACKERYEKGKKDHGNYGPDDFVKKLRKALKDPIFSEKIRNRYGALVIDEFQDTDLDQWAVFEMLFSDKKNPSPFVYLVGDPKQSIYGFRSADVYIYLKAKEYFPEESRFRLGTNFRSHPKLVEALNALFLNRMPKNWMILPSSSESLEILPVAANSSYQSSFNDTKKGRVHFLLFEEKKEKSKRLPSPETEKELLIPAIAKEILRLKEESGIPYRGSAVLVKDRYQADAVQKGLAEYGIPSRMQKSLNVKAASFLCMKELLFCLVKPTDLSGLKKVLGGHLAGYSEEEIKGSWENLILQKARESFTFFSKQLKEKGFGIFFSDFLQSASKEKYKTIGMVLLEKESSEYWFDLRRICQILLAYCPEGAYDASILLAFMEKIELEAPSNILEQFCEEEEDQVHVMTLHKSKGLEFDVVFALALGSRYVGKEDYISVRSETGREIATGDFEEEVTRYRNETDAEKLRQLYVALTRAKERVYIPLVLAKVPSIPAKGTGSALELFLAGKDLADYSFEKAYQNIGSFTLDGIKELLETSGDGDITYESGISSEGTFSRREEKKTELVPPPLLDFSFESGRLLSFSSLAEEENKGTEIFFREEKGISETRQLPPGAETGTIIHEILERICKADLHRQEASKLSPLIRKRCKGTSLEGMEILVEDMITSALKAEIRIGNTAFTLSEIPASDMWIEVEFLYPVGASFLKGFIDLVFRFRGKYFILDWKTNILGPKDSDYTEERMKRCMIESKYDLQASIYSTAMKKYIAMFDKRVFSSLFEGVIYFFLRGKKPLSFYPDLNLAHTIQKGDVLWTEE